MKHISLTLRALADIEDARDFYNEREPGVGEYCVTSLFADINSLSIFHGMHSKQFGFHKMRAKRFPYGIYYEESNIEVQVVAVLDLRQSPSSLRKRLRARKWEDRN